MASTRTTRPGWGPQPPRRDVFGELGSAHVMCPTRGTLVPTSRCFACDWLHDFDLDADAPWLRCEPGAPL
jgi:hypothetical protein